MFNNLNYKQIIFNLTNSLFIIFIISLFISIKKVVYLIIIFLILIIFVNQKIKEIILINLLILCFLLKSLFYFLGNNKQLLDFVYEKHFLYGVKNFEKKIEVNSGDLNKILNIKNYSKFIEVKNDKLGFRNNIDFKDQDYILLGDSFLHNLNIDNNKLDK